MARRLAKAFVLLCLVAVGIGAGMAARMYDDSRPVQTLRPTAAPTVFPRLPVELARSGSRILVTNAGDHPWTSCMVDVNAGVRGGSFSREVGDVRVGERVSLRLRSFRRTDGRAFDSSAEPVQVVDVHCDTPDGPAHFTGRP